MFLMVQKVTCILVRNSGRAQKIHSLVLQTPANKYQKSIRGGVVEEYVDNPHAVSKAQLDISLRKFCDRKTSYICQY